MSKAITHCIRCKKEKKLPPRKTGKTSAKNYVSPRIYELEPYCSRTCCEADLAKA